MGPGTRDTLPSEGIWYQVPQKDMGPVARKEPGTTDTLPPFEQTHASENITFPLQSVINISNKNAFQ